MIKSIALTFDDGPNTVTTPQVLEKLEKYGVTASFFLVGNNINDESATIAERAYKAGCELNNHSLTHSVMPDMPADEIRREIEITNGKIRAITGDFPRFFRPPYIAVNETMHENIDMTFIAGIGAEDWKDEVSADSRAEKILSQVKNGDIILLHDMEGNFRTVDALDMIIPELLRLEYRFLTVSEHFAEHGTTPRHGTVYTNVLQ